MITFDPSKSVAQNWFGSSPLIFIIESEVEKHWDSPNVSNLFGPAIAAKSEACVVAAMEELALLISRPQDMVVLRKKPDETYLTYLKRYGLGAGQILVLENDDVKKDISMLISEEPAAIEKIKLFHGRNSGSRYLFFGATRGSDRLVEMTGIESVSASFETTRKVNDKCYSAVLDCVKNKIPSVIVSSLQELRSTAIALLDAPGTGKIILKEPMGVSGKGMKLISSKDELELYIGYLKRRKIEPKQLIVEPYLLKQSDVNYQLFVHRDGRIEYYKYKEALLDGHKHLGHFTTSVPDGRKEEMFSSAAVAIGEELFKSGYFGVAGIDGLVGADDTIFPLLEINARLNNSSFQWVLDQFKFHNDCMLTSQLSFVLRDKVSFERFHCSVLKGMELQDKEDVLIMNWAAISRMTEFPVTTRVMYSVIADSRERCLDLQRTFEREAISCLSAS